MNTTTNTDTATAPRHLITGNTYPVRVQLKAMGGEWDPKQKGWLVPAGRADEARQLVKGAPFEPYEPRQASRSRHSSGRPYVYGGKRDKDFHPDWTDTAYEDSCRDRCGL